MLYFYHMIDEDIDIHKTGLLSLKGMIDRGMDKLAAESLDKYRYRISKVWKYSTKKPEDLTIDEISMYLKKFRNNREDALNRIYLFRFPPHKGMGVNMDKILENNGFYRLDLDDPETFSYIKTVYWGNYHSHSDNVQLTREYYENVTEEEYFSEYDDNAEILFAKLNHISIVPEGGRIPFRYLTKV